MLRNSAEISAPGQGDLALDFNPDRRLRKAIAHRPASEGITIDRLGTHIHDDGLGEISACKDGWIIESHIVDLPSIIPHGDPLEDAARMLMEEESIKGFGVSRIWPVEFLDRYASLRPGETRPSIAFRMTLDRDLNVTNCDIRQAAFRSRHAYHNGSFHCYPHFLPDQAREWRRLARNLYRKRCRDLTIALDKEAYPETSARNAGAWENNQISDGRLLVHEVSHLTNRMATEFLHAHSLSVPLKQQKASFRVISISAGFEFDMACNRVCAGLLQYMKTSNPRVHGTSPLRNYADYLVIKVLGHYLEEKEEHPDVRQEVRGLACIFNRRAVEVPDYLLQASWEREWRESSCDNGDWHLLASMKPLPWRDNHASNLKDLCEKKKLPFPLIAQRQLQVQGGQLYFAGISLDTGAGKDIQSWAVSHAPEAALNLASQRAHAAACRHFDGYPDKIDALGSQPGVTSGRDFLL